MEIDLNHALSEVEKTAVCNGDCDKLNCVCSSSSSNLASPPCTSSIYLELWHACAGPLTSLPKKGNLVVYFPQGHLEQLASASHFSPLEISTFDLPPHIFCKVVNVQLLVSTQFFFLLTLNCFFPLTISLPSKAFNFTFSLNWLLSFN